jgi:hypothetical protein
MHRQRSRELPLLPRTVCWAMAPDLFKWQDVEDVRVGPLFVEKPCELRI